MLPGNGQDHFQRLGVDTLLGAAPLQDRQLREEFPPSPWDVPERRRVRERFREAVEQAAKGPSSSETLRRFTPLALDPDAVREARLRRGEGGTLSKAFVTASPFHGRLTGPVRFVNQLLHVWELDRNAAYTLLGFEPSDLPYVNDVLNGYASLRGRDAKDRIAHLFQIRKTLSALFRSEDAENEWLRESHALVGDRAPMDLLLEGSMENLLLVREYVETVAGK